MRELNPFVSELLLLSSLDKQQLFVTTTWTEKLEEWPKLCVLKELVSEGFEARCVGMRRKKIRRTLTKLREGTAELQVEVGRGRGLKREERKCTECNSEEVENVNSYYSIQSCHVVYLVLCNFKMTSMNAELSIHIY